jgi:hypothetical protein
VLLPFILQALLPLNIKGSQTLNNIQSPKIRDGSPSISIKVRRQEDTSVNYLVIVHNNLKYAIKLTLAQDQRNIWRESENNDRVKPSTIQPRILRDGALVVLRYYLNDPNNPWHFTSAIDLGDSVDEGLLSPDNSITFIVPVASIKNKSQIVIPFKYEWESNYLIADNLVHFAFSESIKK